MATKRNYSAKKYRSKLKVKPARLWKTRMGYSTSTVSSVCRSIFRTMSVDDMLDLSSELTQYSRGLIELSECSPLAVKCLRANSQRYGQKHSAEVVLEALNKRIAIQNRIENAHGPVAVKVYDVHGDHHKKSVKFTPKIMLDKKKTD